MTRLRLAPLLLPLLLLLTEPAAGSDPAAFERLEYYVVSSPTGWKHVTIEGDGRVVARLPAPSGARRGKEVAARATPAELAALRDALRQVRPTSDDTHRLSGFDLVVPTDSMMGLTIERRRKRTIRLEGKAILACALPLVTDPENLGKHAKRIRLRPVLDVLDAIYDRLVPVRRGEFSGRIVQRGAQLVLTGASELVVRPGRSQLEHLLRALVGREVTLRGSVAAPVAFGQPRQLLKPSLVAPFFVRNIKGLARVQGGATTLEAARLIRPDGEPTGPPLASVDLFGSLSEILTERVDGRILELAGYFIPGSAPALLVTQIDGRVATRTRLIEPKGRVSRITRGKKVEVLYLLPDRNHVRVRTWGWYFTRGTGTLPLDLVVLGEEPPPSRTRGLTGALGRTQ